MKKNEFKKLTERKIIVLDGATGSNLMKRGMPAGVCPEQWILEHRDVMLGLQKEYVAAGTDILYAPTFTCNRLKLREYGLEDEIEQMNHELVAISKEAAGSMDAGKNPDGKVFVAGDMTMTGVQLYPVGKLMFEELVDVYKEQVRYLMEAGVDLLVVETMMSLQECRAALIAAKETCDLPVMVTLTFNEDGRTLFGTDPQTAMVVLESMGADAVGVNCSTGPDQMVGVVKAMKACSHIPVIAKPNAGLPKLVDGQTIYDMEAEEFANACEELIEAGVSIVGGCCGTTPKHIELLAKMAAKHSVLPTKPSKGDCYYLTTERTTFTFDLDSPFFVVGERINPTGKKELQRQLKEGSMEMVEQMAEEQVELGAKVLDINMGMNGIDEKERMLQVIYDLTTLVDVPLSIDSSYIEVIESALRIYPGRALINSISLETEKFEKLIPIAKKYGAMFILLPLSDEGLPKNLEEKKAIIQKILTRAKECGLNERDIVVDGLVATVGANPNAALETIETIRHCKEDLGLATICGLSNISFGLPERQFVNSTFLTASIFSGLTMAICNPSQDLLMNTAFASNLLQNKENASTEYIERVTSRPSVLISKADTQAAGAGGDAVVTVSDDNDKTVYVDVLKGSKNKIVSDVEVLLKAGKSASAIIDEILIPAINETGRLFDEKKYFLPQLIASAEAMKIAIDHMEPLLAQNRTKSLGTIVIATVEGDIHDIGKNLVVLMLKNYGFTVYDLGKDVSARTIVDTAIEKDADIIGLSALMTTTMMEMKNVVELAHKENVRARIILGGAVITQSFADEIGADGYSRDAKEAVTLVKKLLDIE
ncbi:MAG: homocysteine S-methyltransferase family protein [Lachnospiraceae bacterium]|nr:homocysteine S-methyltransferase family protein [Lachnospiraceae bacterium]